MIECNYRCIIVAYSKEGHSKKNDSFQNGKKKYSYKMLNDSNTISGSTELEHIFIKALHCFSTIQMCFIFLVSFSFDLKPCNYRLTVPIEHVPECPQSKVLSSFTLFWLQICP